MSTKTSNTKKQTDVRRADYTESLGELPNTDMINLMHRHRLTSKEKMTGVWLAVLMGIQIISSFAIVPVFNTFASLLTGGEDYPRICLGLAGYAIAQLVFQPIMTTIGRKIGYRITIAIGGIILCIGSFVLAWAMWTTNLKMIILGRFLQGLGAITTSILALAIENCRPHARGALLVILGTGIGLGFAAAMPVGATLDRLSYIVIGTHAKGTAATVQAPYFLAAGLGILGLLSALIVGTKIPRSSEHKTNVSYYLNFNDYMYSLRDFRLIAVYVGAVIIPLIVMMLFYHVPFALRDIGGIARSKVWFVYLFTFCIALISVLPFILVSTSPRIVKSMLVASATLLLLSLLMLVYMPFGLLGLVAGLTFLFVAFNLSEMTLSRIVPRLIEPELQPAALTTFLYLQLIGTVLGCLLGALIMMSKGGWGWLYLSAVLIVGVWLSIVLMVNYQKTDYTLPLEFENQPPHI